MPIINQAGDYIATVKRAAFGESDNGTPFIQFNFAAEEGTITGWAYLSENAFEHSLKSLKEAFGFDGNFEALQPDENGVFTAWDNIQCKIVVEIEDYNGKDRPKVKFINGLGGGAPKVKPLANQSSFLAGLTTRAARIAPKTGGATPPPRAPAARPSQTRNPNPF